MSIQQAIADHLAAALRVTAGVGDMTGTMPPFISVWGDPGGPGDDLSVGATTDSVVEVGVTFTAALVAIANRMAADGVQALTPCFRPGSLQVSNSVAELEFDTVYDAVVDRAVTLPESDSHPAYAVARFRAHVHPIPEGATYAPDPSTP